MKQRFFFDIVRYIRAHATNPYAMLSRAYHYLVDDIIRRQLYKYWATVGVIFQRYGHAQPIEFNYNRVYIQTKDSLYFQYTPYLNGGIFSAEFGKIWEEHELALLRKYTPRRGTFFDIGANFGWFSIHLAREKNAQVHAFEPNNVAYSILRNNIKKNLLQKFIFPQHLAVGDTSRRALLADVGFFGNYVVEKREKGIKIRKVDMISVDDYVRIYHIPKIESIKCDIEGAEFLVMLGAKDTLRRFKPCVMVEIHEDLTKKYGYSAYDIFSLFSEMNYRYYYITEQGPRESTGDIKKELQNAHNFFFYSTH